MAVALSACKYIDEDLENCQGEFEVEYDVRLETNLSAEIQTELEARLETDIAALLYDSLKTIFRKYAHDVDLSFYIGDNRSYHETHMMQAGEASYSLMLPADNYLHLAVANIGEETDVDILRDNNASTFYLHETSTADTIDTHDTGLFTAREKMNILGNVDQTFNVKLYMANCAAILVVRTDSVDYRNMSACFTGLGNGFYVRDSVFTYQPGQVVKARQMNIQNGSRECFYAVTFPSHNTHEEAVATQQQSPTYMPPLTRDNSPYAIANSIWEMHFYVTKPDNKIVETKLYIDQPLQAGNVMIIYAVLQPTGEVLSPNVEVGTSVNFDWKPGLHF